MTTPSVVERTLAVQLDTSEARVRFAVLAGRFDDFRPVLGGRLLQSFRAMETLQFDTEGDFSGKPWQRLAPATILDRVRKGYAPGPILSRSGRLRESLERKTDDSIVEVKSHDLIVGTIVEYAVYHQQPKGPAKGIIPERQPIPDPVPASFQDEVRSAIRDWLVEGRVR